MAGYWHYFDQCQSVLVVSQPVHTFFWQVQLPFWPVSLVFSQFGDISAGLVIFRSIQFCFGQFCCVFSRFSGTSASL